MGISISIIAACCSSAKDLVSKGLSFKLDGTSSTYASFAYALPYYVVLLAALWFAGLEVFEVSLAFFGLVLLRSFTDVLAEGMKMHAFAHGDISLVAMFFSLSPLFLLVTSPLITGDHLSWSGIGAMLLVVFGSLVLVYRPAAFKRSGQRKAILLASGAAVFFSLNSCFDRLAVRHGTPVFAGFTMTLVSALMIAPFVLRKHASREALRAHRKGLWIRGFLEVAYMVGKLTAMQYLAAPYVVGVQRLSVPLSIIGGRLFFNERDLGRRLAAGVLIVAGVLLIAWQQR